jgi:hypothetical protein
MDLDRAPRLRHRSLAHVFLLGILASIVTAYYVNFVSSIDTMGGFSRFLNKITKSDDVPAHAQAVQQNAPPAAYHVQQPQMAQHSNGKRVVGYFVSWDMLVCSVCSSRCLLPDELVCLSPSQVFWN